MLLRYLVLGSIIDYVAAVKWSEWSPCSRSCGGGVAWQTKECSEKSVHCRETVQYRVCNEKACSGDLKTPCSDLTAISVSGPYISVYDSNNPCGTICQDRRTGSRITMFLPNGHRCHGNSNAACLNGTCLSVGCDGILGSDARLDSCGVCGGNNDCHLEVSVSKFEWMVTWSPCSVKCGTGYQKTTIKCSDVTSGQLVMESKCSPGSKPDAAVLECNGLECSDGDADSDSDSYQKDSSPIGRRHSSLDSFFDPLRLSPELALPRWIIGNYSDCSAECGGGVQRRTVKCAQNTFRGGYTPVTSYRCPDPIPVSERACNLHFCPTMWKVGAWSQCSVTCGLGVERRPVFCVKTSISGFEINVSGTECLSSKPTSYRQCHIGECYSSKADMPSIKSENSTFIQIKRLKKVILNIGEKAILLPGQSVKIKCPVENFNRRLLFWTKNNRLIPVLGRIRMTLSGVLKIKNANPMTDAGIYTCIAETLSAHVEVVFHSKQEARKQANEIIRHIYNENEQNLINKPQADKSAGETPYIKPPPYNSIVSKVSNRMTFTTSNWTPCSRTCGYGTQQRVVTCNYVTKKYIKLIPETECLKQGAVKPQTVRKCLITQDCPKWVSADWTPCSSDSCLRENVGLQTRPVKCSFVNSSSLEKASCDPTKRPTTEQECSTPDCVAVWHTSQWTDCRPNCGKKGRKTRILKCVWSVTKEPAYANCKTKARPAAWKTCKPLPCSGDCSDKSRYCSVVGQLRMCRYRTFRSRCCATCKENSASTV